MELYEAIDYAREVSSQGFTDRYKEYGQLADWLEELERLRGVLGDTYDLDRLRELVEADRAGKIMILPVKPGEYAYLITLGREIVRFRVGNVAAEEWGTSFEGYVEGFGPYRTGPNEKVFFSREAAEAALEKKPTMSERKPMTLEELRQMYDSSERVGTRVLLRVYSITGIEGILDCRDDDGICAVYAASGEWLKEKDYGKTWLAYAAEPTHLDRSAWEPCEYCRERDREVYKTQDYPGLCSFEVAQDGPDEIVVNAYNHNTPLTEDICFSFPVLFCPKCGRPLTDAAWDMLEKRLEGAK